MQPGTFSFRLNIPVSLQVGSKQINIPIDTVIMPLQFTRGDLPLLIEWNPSSYLRCLQEVEKCHFYWQHQ
jgi:hypothetical protein